MHGIITFLVAAAIMFNNHDHVATVCAYRSVCSFKDHDHKIAIKPALFYALQGYENSRSMSSVKHHDHKINGSLAFQLQLS